MGEYCLVIEHLRGFPHPALFSILFPEPKRSVASAVCCTGEARSLRLFQQFHDRHRKLWTYGKKTSRTLRRVKGSKNSSRSSFEVFFELLGSALDVVHPCLLSHMVIRVVRRQWCTLEKARPVLYIQEVPAGAAEALEPQKVGSLRTCSPPVSGKRSCRPRSARCASFWSDCARRHARHGRRRERRFPAASQRTGSPQPKAAASAARGATPERRKWFLAPP